MRAPRTHYSRALLYAVAVHILALMLVVFSLQFEALYKPTPIPPREVIQAVAVDRSLLEEKQIRSRAAEPQEQEAEPQRKMQQRAEVEKERKRAEEAEKKREVEEKARVEKKQQALAREKRVAEEKRLAEEKRKLEKEKEERLEQERKRALQQRKQEEEKKRKEEEQQRREERTRQEQKRREEEARKEQLLSELAAEEVEQQQQADAERVNEAITRIADKLARYFNKVGLPSGLVCKVRVRTAPSGEVISAQVVESSANTLFDRQCEIATQKASPLPVPTEQRLFETYFREVDIRFYPWE